MTALRVLVVEDERWVRTAVCDALTRDGSTVTPCGTVRAAVEAIMAGPVDVALVDIGLPDASGVDVITFLRQRQPTAAAVAFTKYDDPETILGVLRAGARGYLLKSTPTERIIPALREAVAGGMPLSPAVANHVVSTLLGTTNASPEPPALTPRESELLALIARGSTYSECASSLGIALGTVQSYIKSIYGKLDVSSKAEAAVVAVRLGLLP